MTEKEMFQERFAKIMPDQRLLAIQLNGFSHSVFYDGGAKGTKIHRGEYSAYTNTAQDAQWKDLFSGYGHLSYQHNAQEIVWVMPEDR